MLVNPLLQHAIIDVANWEKDAEFAVFPQGARAKDAVYAPAHSGFPCLVPGKRYLFKKSKKSYPDQFWGEVIAYRIGCMMGLDVPPAFIAENSDTGQCGALIEWFYQDGKEHFILGGDFMQVVRPGFDREKGAQHNLQDIEVLMRTLHQRKSMKESWKDWWAKALLFDALIGNTDRHQDNWGLIFDVSNADDTDEIAKCRLSPLFDNGTSLGHELFPLHVGTWNDEKWCRYVNKGTHQVKWSLEEQPHVKQHSALLARVLQEWTGIDHAALKNCLEFDPNEIDACLSDLSQLPSTVALEAGRIKIVVGLLTKRLATLKVLLNDNA